MQQKKKQLLYCYIHSEKQYSATFFKAEPMSIGYYKCKSCYTTSSHNGPDRRLIAWDWGLIKASTQRYVYSITGGENEIPGLSYGNSLWSKRSPVLCGVQWKPQCTVFVWLNTVSLWTRKEITSCDQPISF